jgi:hypothetical protein
VLKLLPVAGSCFPGGVMPVHGEATASACCASARSAELMEIISID